MAEENSCASCSRECKDHKARGLCVACYSAEQRKGTLQDWPLSKRRNSVVVEEVRWLSEQGIPAVQWPDRLKMSITAIERALYRAGCNKLANQASYIRRQEVST